MGRVLPPVAVDAASARTALCPQHQGVQVVLGPLNFSLGGVETLHGLHGVALAHHGGVAVGGIRRVTLRVQSSKLLDVRGEASFATVGGVGAVGGVAHSDGRVLCSGLWRKNRLMLGKHVKMSRANTVR